MCRAVGGSVLAYAGGSGMLAIERRNQILEKLQTDRRVVVSELSQL